MKRIACTVLMILMLTAAAANADSPTSQFGFKGWPCRQPACTRQSPARQSASPAPIQAPKPTDAPTQKPASSTSRGDYTTISASAQEQKLWNLMNQDREKNGLAVLPLDARLSELARMKSCDMKQNHCFAHTSPTYGSAAQMLTSFGYAYQGVGENIAHHANVNKAEAAFMSTGHRGNILGSQWKKVGIGVCLDDSGFAYVTQLFVR